MSLVIVVGVTKMKRLVCVGGWDMDLHRPVRLLRADGRHHMPEDGFEVGQVWEMKLQPVMNPIPPHVEDHRIIHRRFVRETEDVAENVRAYMQPKQVALREMFDGALNLEGRRAFVDERCVPGHSTDFWIADRDLEFDEDRVTYQEGWRTISIKYTGAEERPSGTIPKGSLVRLSLARWFRQENLWQGERCYLQVSGWWDLNPAVEQAMLG